MAEKEFVWCDAEMLNAARQMGFGDNWKAALEKTKTMHPPPGGQPAMIRDLIFQAIDYLRVNDLITVPTVAAESQRMVMMSPERQIVNSFFTGGAQISVSYPADDMDFDLREQSMRGNNRPWSHATTFREMIPGHNLVAFYGTRYGAYRANLGISGPFFSEGWLLGGFQLRGLRRELVDTKKMTEKSFHDEIMRQGSMPISLLKLALGQAPLKRDQSIDWKFYGDLPDR